MRAMASSHHEPSARTVRVRRPPSSITLVSMRHSGRRSSSYFA